MCIRDRDTGIGISPEQLPRIFDRFHQAENTSSQSGIGTGIGLTLVKELVELMNGTIEAKSNLNKGTTFQIKLPIIREVEESEIDELALINETYQSNFVQNKKPKTAKTKPVLLLVEDNDEMRGFTRNSLQSNFNIIEASNGVSGIKLAKEYLPDVILSDVMMPEKDGFELTRTLKKYKMTSHIPIILLSAKSKPEARSKGMKSGADLYLTKPFETEDLVLKIEELIND